MPDNSYKALFPLAALTVSIPSDLEKWILNPYVVSSVHSPDVVWALRSYMLFPLTIRPQISKLRGKEMALNLISSVPCSSSSPSFTTLFPRLPEMQRLKTESFIPLLLVKTRDI